MATITTAKSRIISQAQADATQEASRIALSPTSLMNRDFIIPIMAEFQMNAQYEEIEDSLSPILSRAAYDVYYDAELARQACRIFAQVSSDMIPVTNKLLHRLEINGLMASEPDAMIA